MHHSDVYMFRQDGCCLACEMVHSGGHSKAYAEKFINHFESVSRDRRKPTLVWPETQHKPHLSCIKMEYSAYCCGLKTRINRLGIRCTFYFTCRVRKKKKKKVRENKDNSK